MNYEQRTDPYTGTEFTPKRYNQKFETRRNQIAFNNTKSREIRHQKYTVDKTLERNRRILANILNGAKSIVKSKDFLLGTGFIFGYFNKSMVQDNINYQCIYNYAITKLKDGRYEIYSM
jgi:hypothetical protein